MAYILGEQGWCSGESTRLPPLWPGFDSRTRRHMWVEFVVGSRPCSEGFSPGSPVSLPPQKSKFKSALCSFSSIQDVTFETKRPLLFFQTALHRNTRQSEGV